MSVEKSSSKFIPVAAPALVGNEMAYVKDCLETSWISSNGEYIRRFEQAFAQACGVSHALSCANGTVALHLALLALGVGPGDEVLVPTLTYVATANAVMYCEARPVFLDCEPETWNLDVEKVEAAITSRTRGVIVVHLYGHPCDMDPILEIAQRHGLWVVEDAAEAFGAEYRGRPAGSLGDIATFSFYGNKILTTGEGGMVTTQDDRLAGRVRQFKSQGMDPQRRYWFPVVGYNYRMTNIEAAIGLAQLEKADWHIERRRENARWYQELLGDDPRLSLPVEKPWAKNVYWMSSIVLKDEFPLERDVVMQRLAQAGVETRPFFYPLHTLPMYAPLCAGAVFPAAERLGARGMNLPSSANLSREDVEYVCTQIRALGG